MVKLTRKEIDELVYDMEYLLENEAKISVSELCKNLGITFEDYRTLSDLTMPAIRMKNEMGNVRMRAAYYKGVYTAAKNDLDKLDEVMHMAKCFLDRRYAQKPKPVMKSASEQEDEYHGYSDDTADDYA